MKKLALLLAVLLLAISMVPAAMAEGVVNVFNWDVYISDEALEMFEQETGIKVNYIVFATNEEMMVQLENSPGQFDVVFPSDYCVEKLIREELLAPINFDNVPNSQYTIDFLRHPDYDPDEIYSVPYMWGTVGILYNTTMVKEPVTSWSILWDEQYKNNVFMLNSFRDSMGITLKYLGYSMNTRNPAELQAARDLLIKQKQDGMVKAYYVDETKDKMIGGEAALAVMWSGDALDAIDQNPDLAYAVPDEGSNVWADAMVIPSTAKNKENAEIFINFMCRPDIVQLNYEEIFYSIPNSAAIEELGSDYVDNLTANPTQEIIDRCEFFHDTGDFTSIYTNLWMQVINAKSN